jgi:hypothetical protein
MRHLFDVVQVIVVVAVKLREEGAMDMHQHGYFHAPLWCHI